MSKSYNGEDLLATCIRNLSSVEPTPLPALRSSLNMESINQDRQCLLPYVDLDKATGPLAEAVSNLPKRNIFKLLMHAEGLFPPVMGVYKAIFDYKARKLPILDWQLIVLRISASLSEPYEWEVNSPVAIAKNMPNAKLEAIHDSADVIQRNEKGIWTARDLAILRLVDEQLTTWSNNDSTVKELRDLMSDHEVMECFIILGMYTLVARICKGLKIDSDGEMPNLQEGIAKLH